MLAVSWLNWSSVLPQLPQYQIWGSLFIGWCGILIIQPAVKLWEALIACWTSRENPPPVHGFSANLFRIAWKLIQQPRPIPMYPCTPKPWKIKVLHPQSKGYNPKKWRLWVPKSLCNLLKKVAAPKTAPFKSLARSRSRRESRSPGGGFSLRTGYSSAEGQFGDGKARGFRRPIPGGPGGSGISGFGIFGFEMLFRLGALGILFQ